jgi:DNA ligase-1
MGSSSNSNGPNKQVTLNKFFSKPAGHKPALVQATVNSLFNKQNRKKSEEKEEENSQGHVSRDLKRAPSIDVEEDEKSARSSKRAKSNQTKKEEENDDDDQDKIKAPEELKEEPKPTKKLSKKQSKTKVEGAEESNELKVSDEPIQKQETPVIQHEEHTDDDEEAEELAILDCGDDMNQQEGGVSWEKGKPIPYSSLAYTFNLIDRTTKRLEITKYLTQYLIQVISRTPDELLKVIYLCINRLCPDYEGIELGIGESLLIKAIGSSMGRTIAQVKADFKKVGDLGSVAQNSRTTQKTMFKPKLLTVNSVYQDLKTIATTSGNSVSVQSIIQSRLFSIDSETWRSLSPTSSLTKKKKTLSSKSQAKKVGIITKLLASCQGEEAKFIIRSLEGKLRIGLAERTVLVALANAAVRTGVGQYTSIPGWRKSNDV